MIQERIGAVETTRALLRELIDYAGLFPPASLSMTESIANYQAYLGSVWQWILGTFIVPVSRLNEFEEAFMSLPQEIEKDKKPWQLSMIVGPDAQSDAARMMEFINSAIGQRAEIKSVEVKVSTAEEIISLMQVLPRKQSVYFEAPLPLSEECVKTVAHYGQRMKIRTGGETADKIPPAERVLGFIRMCNENAVAFKATAGLHHPLRTVHRLTYHPESASGLMHGFLNVFLGAAYLRSGLIVELADEILNESAAEAFKVDADGVRWRDHRLSCAELAAARGNFAISFGSCSFTEPIDDLRLMGLL